MPSASVTCTRGLRWGGCCGSKAGGSRRVGRTADEADSKRDEVAVPVVEPRFGGGTVEHAVGLVVAAVHLQLELEIGGDVGAGIAPARVERGQHPGHFQQKRVEAWRVGERGGVRRCLVASDEEVVGRQVLQFCCAAHGAGDEVPHQPAHEGLHIRRGEAQLRELACGGEEFGGGARRLAREDEGRLAVNRGALGDHSPDVVHDRA